MFDNTVHVADRVCNRGVILKIVLERDEWLWMDDRIVLLVEEEGYPSSDDNGWP